MKNRPNPPTGKRNGSKESVLSLSVTAAILVLLKEEARDRSIVNNVSIL